MSASAVHIGPYTFDRVLYDAGGDVLYLSIGEPGRAADWDETPDGHGLSFDGRGDLIGVTIVQAKRMLEEGELDSIELPVRPNRRDLEDAVGMAK